ncbi:MAG: single-stranded DNA-binding protein, partial [Mariniphaga sp.]|nr:single-stranded DNA-binding protein [Mariniphaga sp.]
ATTEGRKNKDGEWEDATEWHRIVMFGKQAETCKDYLKKGSKVYIEGRIRTRSWDDKDGNKRYTTEIYGDVLQMLGKRDDQPGGGQSEYQNGNNTKNQSAVEPDTVQSPEEDDLPF